VLFFVPSAIVAPTTTAAVVFEGFAGFYVFQVRIAHLILVSYYLIRLLVGQLPSCFLLIFSEYVGFLRKGHVTLIA